MQTIDVLARKDHGATVSFANIESYKARLSGLSKQLEGVENVVVNVHGYNAPVEKVDSAYKTLKGNLSTEWRFVYKSRISRPSVIGFWWPASWSSTVGFVMASKRVPQAAEYFNLLLDKLESLKLNVVVQAHSLGCRLVTDAIYGRFDTGQFIKRVVLTAPAIPSWYHEKFVPLGPIGGKQSYSVLYSKHDPVLKYAYRLVPSNWKTPAMGSVGLSEYNKNALGVDCSDIVTTHGGYRSRIILYRHILDSFVLEGK